MNNENQPSCPDINWMESPQGCQNELTHLLNDFSDEIPTQHLHGEGFYKVRGVWFQASFSTLRTSIAYGWIPDKDGSFKQEIESFLYSFNAPRQAAANEVANGTRQNSFIATTADEIAKMNDLLREGVQRIHEQITQK